MTTTENDWEHDQLAKELVHKNGTHKIRNTGSKGGSLYVLVSRDHTGRGHEMTPGLKNCYCNIIRVGTLEECKGAV